MKTVDLVNSATAELEEVGLLEKFLDDALGALINDKCDEIPPHIHEDLVKLHNKLEDVFDGLNAEVRELESDKGILEDEVDTLNARVEEQEEELTQLRKLCDDLDQEVATLNRAKKEIEYRLEELEK